MRHAQLFDIALDHCLGKGSRLEQVARGLGDQPALAHAVDDVPGPAHSL